MKELVEVIAKALVDNPDEVVVTETEKESGTFIELKVAPSDMGKVIGKQGRIAKAIRSVVKAAASKEEKGCCRYTVAIRNCRRIFLRQFFFYKNLEEWKMEDTLRVGVISSTHGVRGEVKVYPTTDDVNRFKKLKTVILDTGREQMTLSIENVKFFKNMVILKFKEFNNINEIEKYKGKDLLIRRDQAVKLAPNENFITDLIGLKVVTDEGKEFGTLTDVLQTGANDVYVIESLEGKEYLFPAIPQCILDVNLESQMVTVHILDGLLDL